MINSYSVYYGDKHSSEAFAPFDLVVFDSSKHPPIEPLKKQNKIVLGYVSLAEVARHLPGYQETLDAGISIKENPNWGSIMVDVRSPFWRDMIVKQIVPQVLNKGFDGIFLDTADSAIYMEIESPTEFKGSKNALISIIKDLRRNFPDSYIMLNRGFEILPSLTNDIDFLLAESILVDYNFETKEHFFAPQENYLKMIEIINNAKSQNEQLKVFALDYWYQNDKQGIQKIYEIQRQNGLIPYVSTIDLRDVHYHD